MKIKKGDKIIITRGKDVKKIGNVLKVLPKNNQLLVENLNLITRHIKPRRAGEKGQRIKIPAPISLANVKLICPKCKKAVRIGFRIEQKRKNRFCKKCMANID